MGALMSSPFQPFLISALVLGGLVLIEMLSVVIGASISGFLEGMTGLKAMEDADIFGAGLSWLNIGKVPLLALMMLMLALFSAFGFAIQSFAISMVHPMPAWIASVLSLSLTLPTTRWLGIGIGKIIPKDETYATQEEDLIGRTGIVTIGPVQAKSVARMKIQDQWGNWHFPRVKPATEGDIIPQGTAVLVVDHFKGELLVIRAEEDLLT